MSMRAVFILSTLLLDCMTNLLQKLFEMNDWFKTNGEIIVVGLYVADFEHEHFSLCLVIRIVSVNQKFIEYCMLIIKPITHHQPIRMHFCESSENLLQTRKNQDAELSIWGKVQQKSAKRLGMYFFFFFFYNLPALVNRIK